MSPENPWARATSAKGSPGVGSRQLPPSGRSLPPWNSLKCQICDHGYLEELGMKDSELGSSPLAFPWGDGSYRNTSQYLRKEQSAEKKVGPLEPPTQNPLGVLEEGPIFQPSPGTKNGYSICRVQSRMKAQDSLAGSDHEFQEGSRRASNQAQGLRTGPRVGRTPGSQPATHMQPQKHCRSLGSRPCWRCCFT